MLLVRDGMLTAQIECACTNCINHVHVNLLVDDKN
jgi:hypothetical protein